MCGILLAYSKSARLDVNACENASKKIFSRGPDYNFSSFKLDGRMYLSQTVLSITGNPALNLITQSQSQKGTKYFSMVKFIILEIYKNQYWILRDSRTHQILILRP